MVLPIHSENTMRGVTCVYSADPTEDILQHKELLSVINFDGMPMPSSVPKQISSGLELLGNPGLKEVWYCDTSASSGIDNQCFWSKTDECILAAVWVDETKFPDFKTAINDAYQRILQFINFKGYPHIIRMWNYMADINLGAGDNERYKQFCLGRYEAFVNSNYKPNQFPSASALGHYGGDTVIYLMAAKHPGVHFENPQQMSAYNYPREYGPESPSFARATLVNWSNQRQLFISGTASIIGYQSMHADDLISQLMVTCQNIGLLLKHVAETLGEAHIPQMSMLKVYLRNSHDLDEAKAYIARHFGVEVPVIFLHAEICRKELLVEIEGQCTL